MVEINAESLPLQTLETYLSNNKGKRKEKWISLSQVLQSLSKIN